MREHNNRDADWHFHTAVWQLRDRTELLHMRVCAQYWQMIARESYEGEALCRKQSVKKMSSMGKINWRIMFHAVFYCRLQELWCISQGSRFRGCWERINWKLESALFPFFPSWVDPQGLKHRINHDFTESIFLRMCRAFAGYRLFSTSGGGQWWILSFSESLRVGICSLMLSLSGLHTTGEISFSAFGPLYCLYNAKSGHKTKSIRLSCLDNGSQDFHTHQPCSSVPPSVSGALRVLGQDQSRERSSSQASKPSQLKCTFQTCDFCLTQFISGN